MSGAANAPASSPPQQGAGRGSGGAGERNTSLLAPFWESAFLPPFPTSSAFPPPVPGEEETSWGFSPSSAHTSQVQFKEIRLSREGRAKAAQSLSHHIVEVPVTRSPASATPCALCPAQDLDRWGRSCPRTCSTSTLLPRVRAALLGLLAALDTAFSSLPKPSVLGPQLLREAPSRWF